MRSDYFIYRNAGSSAYAASIAATWVWAPALFVASSMAYLNGLLGFLMFLIPNVLTLIIFGWVVSRLPVDVGTLRTLGDVAARSGDGQRRIHLMISTILLICSTAVQMVGIHVLLVEWFGISRLTGAAAVSVISLITVMRGGLRASIMTDRFKYLVIFVVGLLLMASALTTSLTADSLDIVLRGEKNPDWIMLALTFGIPTAIGLLAAPYADQTFWQRAVSIGRDRVFITFAKAAAFFAIIPILFGLIGFLSPHGDATWSIAKAFDDTFLRVALGAAVLCALISTIDSNLCAISSITWAETSARPSWIYSSMPILLLVAGSLMVLTNLTIIELFLIYGTTRTVVCMPTILITFNKYNPSRLFWSTLAAAVIAPIGFIACKIIDSPFAVAFTLVALLLPLIGISKQIPTISDARTKNYQLN